MEKKKLKLSITGSSQKTFSSIEHAKTKTKSRAFIVDKDLEQKTLLGICFRGPIGPN